MRTEELVPWLRDAGAIVTPTAEALVIDDQDVRLRVAWEGELYTVRATDRGTDRGVRFAAADWEDVERYLTFRFAGPRRRGRGLPRLPELGAIPYAIEQLAPGFTAVRRDAYYEVHWTDEAGRPRAITGVDMFDAVDFSHYARLTPAELRTAIDAPDGRPLLPERGRA